MAGGAPFLSIFTTGLGGSSTLIQNGWSGAPARAGPLPALSYASM